MKAAAKEALSTSSVVITSSLARATSAIINSSDLRQFHGLKGAIFATETISAIKLRISPEQTQHFEMKTTTSKDLSAPWATQRVAFIAGSVQTTTLSIRSSPTPEFSTSITVSAGHVGGYKHPASMIEPSSAVLTSTYLLSSVTFNSTINLLGGQTDVKDECDSNACDTYVTRWVDFYLNIGGWIMLSIVLVGIVILTATYIQGRKRRKEIKALPQLMYREMHRYRDRWV
ncbi:hypothetical protein ABFA07_018432 [Porites harrisoni]